MVCGFGLSTGGASWLVETSAAGLRSLHNKSNIVADNVVPWWKSPDAVDIQPRHKAKATAFADPDEKKPDKKEAGGDDDKKKDEKDEKAAGGCFPPSATVYVKTQGPVCIADLKTGDLILVGTADSMSLAFSPFIGYLHHEASAIEEYLQIETSVGSKFGSSLMLSREHLIFAASTKEGQANAMPAGDLCEGDWLCRASCEGDLQRAQISKIAATKAEGRFCPLTQSGTVIVDSCLCSCYVDIGPFITDHASTWLRRLGAMQEVVHGVFLPLRLTASLGLRMQDGKGQGAHECGWKGIHPYVHKLMMLPGVASTI